MPVPATVLELVERFKANEAAYRSGHYNETQVRREFIDPFFECLGWDVNNRQGYAEPYKDVVHEDSIRIDGAKKAPDYCFRIGGVRKFFLEAKKPAVNVRDDVSPAYQLRRYAWSANLPVSILTDFEELSVYDCRVKPAPTDKASTARKFYLKCEDYPEKWDELFGRFSREAVLKGGFDKFAEAGQGRGAATVDAAFLAEIESWRDVLARNLALRNPWLGQADLNDAVQRTIDRIIFLRLCEDRGIEDYGTLKKVSGETGVYDELKRLFTLADERYNSGLFHFRQEKGRAAEDRVTMNLVIDDKVLKGMLRGLYYPDSPYEFSVLPADILGQVYEQFLGKVIRLTAGHQARVEEKPEVRKSGGVFYTPTPVVEYIIANTVGRLLEGKATKDVDGSRKGAAPLRVLDPACGSGSFLIVAYQRLLDWYRDRYVADGPEQHCKGKAPKLCQRGTDNYALTVRERKRILLDHVYGVDIDPQAVEVTKLSLLLKVIEGENAETLGQSRYLFSERALPDLDQNIKCGNSLVGSDYLSGQQLDAFSPEDVMRVNAFDWAREFPFIVSDGGFDAVVGNPPYVRQETIGEFKGYFAKHFQVYHGVADLYVYFIERAVGLLREGGLFSYIVANKWMRANYGAPLRAWLAAQALEELVDFGDLPVFKGVTTYPCILRVRKGTPAAAFEAATMDVLNLADLPGEVSKKRFTISRGALSGDAWSLTDDRSRALLEKIRGTGVPLGEYLGGKIYYGIKTGLNEAFVIDAETRASLIAADPRSAELIKPFLAGRDIKRYCTPAGGRFLIFARRGVDIGKYPAIEAHLSQYRQALTPKPPAWTKGAWQGRKPGNYQWFEIQDTVDYFPLFDKPKIVFPDMATRGNFTLDECGHYPVNTVYVIPSNDLALLCVLNSKLMTFFYAKNYASFRGGYLRFFEQYLRELPIALADSGLSKKLAPLAGKMMELHRQVACASGAHQQTLVERQIAATDAEIDRLVYGLYGLTDEEISLIEG